MLPLTCHHPVRPLRLDLRNLAAVTTYKARSNTSWRFLRIESLALGADAIVRRLHWLRLSASLNLYCQFTCPHFPQAAGNLTAMW